MENKDLPAYPTSPNKNDPAWAAACDGGLTKRELVAAMAMQGLCGCSIPGPHNRPKNRAREAIESADELLKYLDEINTEQSEIRASGTGSPPDTFKPTTS